MATRYGKPLEIRRTRQIACSLIESQRAREVAFDAGLSVGEWLRGLVERELARAGKRAAKNADGRRE